MPGDVGALTVRLYGVTGALDDTTITANVIISSNDPVNPTVVILVTLDVDNICGQP
ncbi:MAG: hypothetical protein O7D34_12140 [Ignavibacteria bacterium]|nr:hypothetical protein [Ignavibacteria bacterium]